ncbi:hypothetical protein ACFX2G_040621 [Malus domestica]
MSVLVKCVKLAGSTNHVLLIENNPAETSHVTVGDLQEVVLGCSATIASKYLKTKFSNSVKIDALKENMAYFLQWVTPCTDVSYCSLKQEVCHILFYRVYLRAI